MAVPNELKIKQYLAGYSLMVIKKVVRRYRDLHRAKSGILFLAFDSFRSLF